MIQIQLIQDKKKRKQEQEEQEEQEIDTRQEEEEEEEEDVLLSHIACEKRSTFKDMGCSAYGYGWKAQENSISFG